MRTTALWLILPAVVVACGDGDGAGDTEQMPEWVESVYPEPGTTLAVPDVVEVDHAVQGAQEDVRLVVDGVDVTTYASFPAGSIRYESGLGPVTLEEGEHTAQVQRVRLQAAGAEYEVLDSYSWEFRTG